MEVCRKQIEELAPDGAYILSTGCEFPQNAPLENAYSWSGAVSCTMRRGRDER
jgi:uroporphyrinogen-III decarboxylase